MLIKDLVKQFYQKPFGLLYGAGLSSISNGPSWKNLKKIIINEFPEYDETWPFFELMEEIAQYDDNQRKIVEELVRKHLNSISANQDHKYIFSLPWKAIMTTNYDRIPEGIKKTLDGQREVKTLITKREVNFQNREILYCFKIFGDLKKSYPDEGSMVLTRTDRRQAGSNQANLIKNFMDILSSANMIYIGYSFDDDLVIDVLNDIKRYGRKYLKGYAIVRDQSRIEAKTLKRLKNFDIEIIEGTIEEFIKECKLLFGDVPESPVLEKPSIQLRGRAIEISKQVLSNFLNLRYHLINQNDFVESIDMKSFLEGNKTTMQPYADNFDFNRKFKVEYKKQKNEKVEYSHDFVQERIDLVSNTGLFFLTGGWASGKSTTVRNIAYEWYRSGNPVLIINEDIRIDKKVIENMIEDLENNFNNLVN